MAKIITLLAEAVDRATLQSKIILGQFGLYKDQKKILVKDRDANEYDFSSDQYVSDPTNNYAGDVGVTWGGTSTNVQQALDELLAQTPNTTATARGFVVKGTVADNKTIAPATNTDLTFLDVLNNTGDVYDGTGIFTADIQGAYLVFTSIQFNRAPDVGLSAGAGVTVRYRVNGSFNDFPQNNYNLGANRTYTDATIEHVRYLYLNVGDTVEVNVANPSGNEDLTLDGFKATFGAYKQAEVVTINNGGTGTSLWQAVNGVLKPLDSNQAVDNNGSIFNPEQASEIAEAMANPTKPATIYYDNITGFDVSAYLDTMAYPRTFDGSGACEIAGDTGITYTLNAVPVFLGGFNANATGVIGHSLLLGSNTANPTFTLTLNNAPIYVRRLKLQSNVDVAGTGSLYYQELDLNGFTLTGNAVQTNWYSEVGNSTASEISYDNSTSGLSATDVQGAIDETVSNLATFEYRGAWNNATAYDIGDIVTEDGYRWIAKAESTNQTPADGSSFWTRIDEQPTLDTFFVARDKAELISALEYTGGDKRTVLYAGADNLTFGTERIEVYGDVQILAPPMTWLIDGDLDISPPNNGTAYTRVFFNNVVNFNKSNTTPYTITTKNPNKVDTPSQGTSFWFKRIRVQSNALNFLTWEATGTTDGLRYEEYEVQQGGAGIWSNFVRNLWNSPNYVNITSDDASVGITETVVASSGATEETVRKIDLSLSSGSLANKQIDSTGIKYGSTMAVNVTPSLWDLGEGEATIMDYSDPQNITSKLVTWTAQAGLTVTNLATDPRTNVALSLTDTADTGVSFTNNFTATVDGVSQTVYIAEKSSDNFTSEQLRKYAQIGRVVHSDNVNISFVVPLQRHTESVLSTLLTFVDLFPAQNVEGNEFTPATGVNLSVDKSAGKGFRIGSNYETNLLDPDVQDIPVATPTSHKYRYRDGVGGWTDSVSSNVLDPAQYDDGTGTLTSVTNNRWTAQPVYVFAGSGSMFIQYGQDVFASKSACIEALATLDPVLDPNLTSDAIFRGWFIVRSGGTDTNDSNDFEWRAPLSERGGGTGTPVVVDVQTAYDNSVDPEFKTDTTRGALTGQVGTGLANTTKVYEVRNEAGTTTWSVDGNGDFPDTPKSKFDRSTTNSTNPSSVSPDGATTKQAGVNGLAQNCTLNMPTNPADGMRFTYRVEATGTHTLTWSGLYNDLKNALPTTTTANKIIYAGFVYNGNNSVWDVVSVVVQD